MWIQTWALMLDAYRELNARKLFWITLILTGLVVLVCATLGIDENGVTFLWFDLPLPINSTVVPVKVFYLSLFTGFGVSLWLTWIATILALVGTAGIIPDLIASGSIETMLSKPISRLRLFMTKYVFGLLFMALQLLLFCGGFFMLIGVRGGSWQPGIFLAIPIVLLFFSYLFSVCVLLGMLTRSTVASLLITLLLWFGLFGINLTDALMISARAAAQLNLQDRQESLDNEIGIAERHLDLMRRDGEPIPGEAGVPLAAGATNTLESVNERIQRRRENIPEAEDRLERAKKWEGRIFLIKTVFPKTSETIGLLERNLISDEDLDRMMPEEEQDDKVLGTMADKRINPIVQDTIRSRSMTWIIGTSVVFELVVLGAAAFIFARRDF